MMKILGVTMPSLVTIDNTNRGIIGSRNSIQCLNLQKRVGKDLIQEYLAPTQIPMDAFKQLVINLLVLNVQI